MSTKGSGPANTDSETARIETFSDGVFAIAITLLVIEIGVPHLENGPEDTTLFGALIEQWPSYLAYVIRFLQIGLVDSFCSNSYATALGFIDDGECRQVPGLLKYRGH